MSMSNVHTNICAIKEDAAAALQLFLASPGLKQLHFARIETEWQRQQLRAFRLKVYGENLRYMLNQIGESGFDEYDDRSYIFAIWHHDKIAATIRLTPAPFESAQYIEAYSLDSFLGEGSQQHYLEWSRLSVDASLKLKGLVGAITIYAGLYALIHTNYREYFGYTRHSVRRLFSKFQVNNNALQFRIPSRGEHFYLLLKGSFVADLHNLKLS